MNRTLGLLAAAALLGGCSDDSLGPGSEGVPEGAPVLVSGPVASAGPLASLRDDNTHVYISMVPGTNLTGTSVTVHNGGGGPSVTAPMVDGGFDPVRIVAAVGDSVVILVTRPTGPVEHYAKVPARSRPVVVRTAPRHRRTDIPLNSVIEVVFSEPMDPATLADALRLRRNGVEVAGTVTGIPSNGEILTATFTPAELLDASAVYELEVSTAARSRAGTALDAPLTVGFTTGTQLATTGTLTVTATTTGTIPGVGLYELSLIGAQLAVPARINANGSVVFHDVPAGSYRVELSGVSVNCTVAGEGPSRDVTVVAGTVITIAFELSCGTAPVGGTLVITTSTTGADADPDGYRFRLNWGPEQSIGINASVTILDLPPGGYSVQFGGVSPNCTVVSDPLNGVVSAGAVTTVAVTVACNSSAFQPSGTIAFVAWEEDGRLGLYVANPDGTDRRRLVASSSADFAWSPDGARIAVALPQGGGGDIHVINVDGSGLARLTDDGQSIAPSWSPDGSRIAFSKFDGRLYLMNADGSGVVRLHDEGPSLLPSWSPDGRRIAFQGWDDRIRVIEVDRPGASSEAIGPADLVNGGPVWSPDGTMIAFERRGLDPEWTGDLYVMNADGSGVRRVVPTAWAPVWSPDGRGLAFVIGDGIGIVNPDGSGMVVFPQGPGMGVGAPSWSPDGSALAFAGSCGPQGRCIRYVLMDGRASSASIDGGFEPAWGP